MTKETVIQVGSTRDGLEPYRERAEVHGMVCGLVETPEYLELRRQLGRQTFEVSLAVAHPADADEVVAAIRAANLSPTAAIAGFERYNYSAYEAAKILQIPPYDQEHPFKPLTKIEERAALEETASPFVLQPAYKLLQRPSATETEIAHMRYPLVVKPIDGGGGLGTFVVQDYAGLTSALQEVAATKNYDGGEFAGIMLEEFVAGDEYSVQGFVRGGKPTILSLGKKFVFTEPADTTTSTQNRHVFRESGLMVIGGDYIDDTVRQFTQACVSAFRYQSGAFHIDMKSRPEGYYFLEMGFRMSGFGIANLTNQISGYNWAEETFSSLLRIPSTIPREPTNAQCIGQVRARLPSEIEAAQALAAINPNVTVEVLDNKPPTVFSDRLRSDITRHSGTIGRITVEGKSVQVVEETLLRCLGERASQRVQ